MTELAMLIVGLVLGYLLGRGVGYEAILAATRDLEDDQSLTLHVSVSKNRLDDDDNDDGGDGEDAPQPFIESWRNN